jgi:hypothetical protein
MATVGGNAYGLSAYAKARQESARALNELFGQRPAAWK